MEIVIKISEDVYTRLFDKGIQDNEIATDDICEMARALRLGTPLSKHGRLIDADEIQFENTEFDTYNDYCIAFDTIDQADTIIEADKLPNNELENPFNDSRFGG